MKIFFFLAIISLITPSVANDNFSDRIALGSNPAITFNSTLSDASVEPFEPGHSSLSAQVILRSRWWTWSAPESGWYRINIHSESPLNLAVYRGTKLEKLTALSRAWLPLPGDPTTLPFFMEGQESVQIAVATSAFDDGESFSFTLEKTVHPAPNDQFENRIQLDEFFDGELRVETHGSTLEPEGPQPARFIAEGSVWWSLKPARDTTITISFLTPDDLASRTRVIIYEGDQLATLRESSKLSTSTVGGSSTPVLSLLATKDTEYQICVFQPFGSFGGDAAPAQFKLRVTSDQVVPRNDDLDDANILTGRGPHYLNNITLNAGRETGELRHLEGDPARILRKTTWWKWTAPIDGIAMIARAKRLSNTPDHAVLYELGAAGTLTKLGEVRNNVIRFSARGGSSYLIVTGHDTAKSDSSERFIFYQLEPGITPESPIEIGTTNSFSFEDTNFSDPPHPNQWIWTPLTGGYYRIGPEPNIAALSFAVQQQDLTGEWSYIPKNHSGNYYKLEQVRKCRVSLTVGSYWRWVIPATVELLPSSTNKDFSEALTLSTQTGNILHSTTLGAVLEPEEPATFYRFSIWWKWTAPSSGPWEFLTNGPGFVERFSGRKLSSLQQYFDENRGVGLPFLADEGETFYFRHLELSERPVSVMIQKGSSTPNDLRNDAINLEGQIPAISRGSLMAANSEPGEPEGKNAWWQWTAPSTSTIHLSTKGRQISVYEGTPQTPLDDLVPVSTDRFGFGDGNIVFEAVAFKPYLIAVHQEVPSLPSSRYPWNGAVELKLAKFERSPGDRFEDRIILPSQTSVRYEGVGMGATWTDPEISPCPYCNGSVWLEWTPPVTGTYVFEGRTVIGNDDGIGLFTINEAEIREQLIVAIDDDDDTQSSFRFSVEADRTYFLILFTDKIFNTYEIRIAPFHGFDLWVDTWLSHLEQFSNYYPEITKESLKRDASVLRDGVTNIERYLFGMDPRTKLPWDQASVFRPTLNKLDGSLELRYRLGSQASFLDPAFMTHGGEVSVDGKTWNFVPPTNLGNRWFVVRTPIDHPRKFLRFRAVEE